MHVQLYTHNTYISRLFWGVDNKKQIRCPGYFISGWWRRRTGREVRSIVAPSLRNEQLPLSMSYRQLNYLSTCRRDLHRPISFHKFLILDHDGTNLRVFLLYFRTPGRSDSRHIYLLVVKLSSSFATRIDNHFLFVFFSLSPSPSPIYVGLELGHGHYFHILIMPKQKMTCNLCVWIMIKENCIMQVYVQ